MPRAHRPLTATHPPPSTVVAEESSKILHQPSNPCNLSFLDILSCQAGAAANVHLIELLTDSKVKKRSRLSRKTGDDSPL